MRTLALALLTSFLLVAASASASDRDDRALNINSSLTAPARWAPRRDARTARYLITSREGRVALLVTPTAVSFQVADGKMNSIERAIADEQDVAEDTPLASAMKAAKLAGARVLLKLSAECRVRELRDVDYRNGNLMFVTQAGERVFDQLALNEYRLVAAFPEREARAFVREFRRLKAADR